MERMKLTEKEKEQILKRGAEAMSKIIERMSIEMGDLEEENKKLKEMSGKLGEMNGKLGEWVNNLEEENKKLKYVIDTLMEKTGIENIKLATGEVFLNPKKRLELNTDFIEEDTLQELRDLGKI